MESAMDAVQAWELLQDPSSGRLGMEAMYDLMVRAGCSHGVAREVSMKRGWDRLSAGEVL